MASSGSFSTTGYEGRYLTFSWSIASQSVANNTTTISWTLKGDGGGTKYFYTQNIKVVIDGVTVYNLPMDDGRILLYDGTVVKTGTYTIKHNADGTRSFTASAEAGIYVWAVNCTGSGSFTLNPIARASQPSCVTWPEHTQNVGSFGDTISIHMNRQSSSLTHTVRYQFGTQSGTIATGVTTGTTWTIPLTLMNLIPAATSGSGTIYVDTYSGSTKVGTKYCGFTATVPASVKPSCSFTLDDVTGVDDIYGSPVKGLSQIKVTVSSTTAYSSPIASCVIQANGVRYNGTTATTGKLTTSGTSTVTVTVTDKRGRSGSSSYNMSVKNYASPAVTALSVHRCNQDGTNNDNGGYVKVTFSATVSSMSSVNTAAYKLQYKKSADSSYTSVTFSELANKYAVSGHTYVFAASADYSYDVRVTATDKHSSTTRNTSASTAFTLINFGADGQSIGIMKLAERSPGLDMGCNIYMNNHGLYGPHGIFDTRGTNKDPQWYMDTHGRGVVWEFKKLVDVGFTSPATTFGPMQTIIPWVDSSGGLPRQNIYENGVRWTRIASSTTAWGRWESELLRAYPVGSIYLAYNHTNPGTLFGGTWVRLENAFLWASGASATIGQTGGESTHTLTIDELPSHSHGSVYSGMGTGTKNTAWLASGGDKMVYGALYAGGGQAHNNMPPYIQISAWRRTA